MIHQAPEALLLCALTKDIKLLTSIAIKEIRNFIEHGECGLAYDVFVFEMQDQRYAASIEAIALIKQAAQLMNIAYPRLSTE
ncbi:MAG: hypothetical protein IBJ14_01955 [Hydrogenophaga sp.]|nr:hypothetical protein [Hydrogenophaga sp.]